MTVRQYIGARYVPLFADPIQWDSTSSYEPLTVVMNEGTSYVSKQSVPAGIQITNETYWLRWADYNAQLEEYIRQVQTYTASINALNDALPIANFDANDTIKDAIDAIAALLPGTAFDSTNTVDARFDVIEANNWVTTSRITDANVTTAKIADNAVTTAKIADGAVTSAKIADGTIVNSDIANNTIKKEKLANDDIFLIFGDSWTNFTDHPNWSNDVNKILGCGDVINYGVGGAGFTISQNSIATQIALANTQLTSAQKNNVKYVIVLAGVNDFQPYMPSGFLTAVRNALDSLKQTYPNAVIQWHPTTCEPSYGNSTAPKWLFTIAAFWYYISKYGCESTSGQYGNRFCFPKCGPCFYWNSEAAISEFFDNTKLHLNEYGKNAIVNSILDGFGKVNMNYFRTYWFNKGERKVEIQFTPTDVKLLGAYTTPGDVSFGGQGPRILAAMAAMQAQSMCDNNTPVHFFNTPSVDSSTNPPTFDYCGIWPNGTYTTCDFGVRASYTGGIRYIMTC